MNSKNAIDLSQLDWTLRGWRPHVWKLGKSVETGEVMSTDIAAMPAQLPGSVQGNLKRAGILPDWNVGLNSLLCEWAEHRHWDFSAHLSAEEMTRVLAGGERVFLCAESLDYSGWILVNDVEVAQFRGAMIPQRIELTPFLKSGEAARLSIVFDAPPEEQGQIGYSSRSKFFKPRYSYSWDWCPRLVPAGVLAPFELKSGRDLAVSVQRVLATLGDDNAHGDLQIEIGFDQELSPNLKDAEVEAVLRDFDGKEIARKTSRVLADGGATIEFSDLPVQPWFPNGSGAQPLYDLEIVAKSGGAEISYETRKIGFKRIEWRACEGAAENALPWICVANGTPVFLQGMNWVPPQLNYLDATNSEYSRLLETYREMGCNILRVWGGAILGTPHFFNECDRLGIFVWQEFPLSSSGVENEPPSDPQVLAELEKIATSYVRRRRDHVSLLFWCGGNELQARGEDGIEKPCDESFAALAMMRDVVAREDGVTRYVATSSTGPEFYAFPKNFGKGVHHDVHGPWGWSGVEGGTMESWREYWENDDALFRSEVGMPGAMSVELIRKYAGHEELWPPTTRLWKHSCAWWIQWARYRDKIDTSAEEETQLAQYVEITQREQAEALSFAAQRSKERFPRCGGFMLWEGHDLFPCLNNNAIIDCEGNLKPAAVALGKVFRGEQSKN